MMIMIKIIMRIMTIKIRMVRLYLNRMAIAIFKELTKIYLRMKFMQGMKI